MKPLDQKTKDLINESIKKFVVDFIFNGTEVKDQAKPVGPREFWIQDRGLHYEATDYKHEPAYIDTIHVIEHSAYLALKDERDKLIQRLEDAEAALKFYGSDDFPYKGKTARAYLAKWVQS